MRSHLGGAHPCEQSHPTRPRGDDDIDIDPSLPCAPTLVAHILASQVATPLHHTRAAHPPAPSPRPPCRGNTRVATTTSPHLPCAPTSLVTSTLANHSKSQHFCFCATIPERHTHRPQAHDHLVVATLGWRRRRARISRALRPHW